MRTTIRPLVEPLTVMASLGDNPELWDEIISDTINAVVVSSACSASDGGLGACIVVNAADLGFAIVPHIHSLFLH